MHACARGEGIIAGFYSTLFLIFPGNILMNTEC